VIIGDTLAMDDFRRIRSDLRHQIAKLYEDIQHVRREIMEMFFNFVYCYHIPGESILLWHNILEKEWEKYPI
jgi:hypothetical protein